MHLLTWEGQLSRARVLELFEVSPVRASEWIKELRDLLPDGTTWDPVGRRFMATDAVYRSSARSSDGQTEEGFAAYLALTRMPSVHSGGDNGIHVFPDFNVPSARVFATLRRAIAEKMSVALTYRSMQRPELHRRIVEPHSLVRAGRRWHLRAYCLENEDFRDYALGRIAAIEATGELARRGAQDDQAWVRKVEVNLVPHPKLSPQQQEAVRQENFQGTSAHRRTTRAALVAYLIQDLRAATDLERQQPPDFQIAVDNIEELRSWLFPG